MFAEVAVFGNAESARSSSRCGGVDKLRRDDIAGIGHGPWPQGDGVEQREEARVQTDTQHQGRTGGDREAWLGAQAPEGVANVLPQAVDPGTNPNGARGLARERDIAHIPMAHDPGFRRRESRPLPVALLHGTVKFDFLGQFGVESSVANPGT